MTVVRFACAADKDAVASLLERAGPELDGLTNLPSGDENLDRLLAAAEAAVAPDVSAPTGQEYLMVLEDPETGAIVGTSGIIAGVGLSDAFYSYRVGRIVHASRRLGVHVTIPTLYLSNDYTGGSELCRLYLDAEWRKSGNGRLLSLSRTMLVADHPERFSDPLIAELRGVLDENGESPFWIGLPSHFLGMSFVEADRRSGSGEKTFIAELMPTQPIYVPLLRPETQEAIGRTHPDTEPALRLLQEEGFRYEHYIDIFDGGPTVEANRDDLLSTRESRVAPVAVSRVAARAAQAMVTNRRLEGFRSLIAQVGFDEHELRLSPDVAARLDVTTGDEVRFRILGPGARP
ncbi:MAG: arginine N-succinyltransferase [Actinomycetota bacterium]|nr:arginine N-succinyltransferase [Actinomycetota bacterium]